MTKPLIELVEEYARARVAQDQAEAGAVTQDWQNARQYEREAKEQAGALLSEIRQRLSELEANERRYLWQPIETAPEGDDLFLLFEPHAQEGFIFVGARNRNGEWINNLDLEYQHPTHWMPLPEAPAIDAAIDASRAEGGGRG